MADSPRVTWWRLFILLAWTAALLLVFISAFESHDDALSESAIPTSQECPKGCNETVLLVV